MMKFDQLTIFTEVLKGSKIQVGLQVVLQGISILCYFILHYILEANIVLFTFLHLFDSLVTEDMQTQIINTNINQLIHSMYYY